MPVVVNRKPALVSAGEAEWQALAEGVSPPPGGVDSLRPGDKRKVPR